MPPPHHTPTPRRLIALSVCVLLVHALLLGGVPSTWGLLGRQADAPAQRDKVLSFATRTLAQASVADSVPARPKPQPRPRASKKPGTAARPAAVVPATQTGADAAALPDTGVATTAAAAATPLVPDDTPANASVLPASVSPNDAGAAAAATTAPPAPTEPVVPASTAAPASPVAVPAPIRLLYDGRGEERGFIKYAASAELLWLPDGSSYSARLEISAWGFRVRTWTSKGAMTDAGLEPLRFGDKPRGAEVATHFQRDKGIISFSANNPDVALQAGAQDKLSALLQLSSLVAGAPERYSAGDSIRFQAADAHRAELWDFKVGALEPLELPGGTKQALKLSKSPTVEFDQGIEVWLAPDMQYLPVRLRITEANGAFADLLWRKTQNSE